MLETLSAVDLLEALPEPVYLTDAAGRITFYNRAAATFWGVEPELGKSEFCGSWKLFWPDGKPMAYDQCPMAMALKHKRPVRGYEAVAERPDGTRVSFAAFPTPLFGADKVLIGAINILVDLSEWANIYEAAQRYAAIFECSDDAILAKDLDGIITNWNRGAERLFGYTADEVVGRPVTVLIPEDRQDEEPGILARLRQGEQVEQYETIRRRKDGRLIDASLSVSPIKDRHGRIIGASKIVRDITLQKRAEEQQQLLLREMDHRVKNFFSLANGIVSLSARSTGTSAELASAVTSRLRALAEAHALTIRGTSLASDGVQQTTMLFELIETVFAPYQNNEGQPRRARISGCNFPISSSALTGLAMLLHEFATNAAKYGALSTPDGRIDVSCDEDGDTVALRWAENGGPSITRPPKHAGFGTLLQQSIVTTQFGGQAHREWRREGLVITIYLQRSRLQG